MLIERDTFDGAYGMRGECAVIDHPEHGRLYLAQGYGGERDMRGGAMRWEHGVAVKLAQDTTLADARKLELSAPTTTVLDWDGNAVAAVARKAGL